MGSAESPPSPSPTSDTAPRVLAVIPARLGSTRLPRKPLLRESGLYLFEHVWRQVARAGRIERAILATDSQEILAAADRCGVEAVMTSSDHPSGTDRVIEVARTFPAAEIVLNVQGDEPEIDPGALDRLVESIDARAFAVATLAAPLASAEEMADPAIVKVVCDARERALYFSRSPIPHDRAGGRGAWRAARHHVGVYAFRREALLRFAELPRGALERLESLEQLRLLENGIQVGVIAIDRAPRGIDTPEDYSAFVRAYKSPERGSSGVASARERASRD